MTPEQYQRCTSLFERSLDLPESEREKFARVHVMDDAEVLRTVLGMIRSHAQHPPEVSEARRRSTTDRYVGRSIDGFTIRERLGQGGMGRVYLAEQETPRREVAIKLLGSEFPTAIAYERFRREIEISGHLKHEGIAAIYLGGTGRIDGRDVPYFAMELVRGMSLTEYAKAKAMSVEARVALVRVVLDAVGYAHRLGVIHRDLKPANMLVGEDGQPKVLDFGIARALHTEPENHDRMTQTGQMLGTLNYMAPEQLKGAGERVDARCDIYALGVVLFELFTGKVPHEMSMADPTRIGDSLRQDAPRLGTQNPELRTDLEWIVAKALEKDRERRYSSASEFSEDLRRYLAHEPVLARPPTVVYQVTKFARRNKVLVGGVLATVASLVGGLVAALIGFSHAREQKQVADERRDQIEKQLWQIHESAGLSIDAIDLDKIKKLVQARSNTEDYRRIVTEGMIEPALSIDFKAYEFSPRVEAGLRYVAGDKYQKMRMYPEAETQYQACLRIWESLDGDTAADIAAAKANLGYLNVEIGRAQDADRWFRESVPILRTRPEPKWKDAFLAALHGWAQTRLSLQDAAGASAMFAEVLERRKELDGARSIAAGRVLTSLGISQTEEGRLEQAAATLEEAEEILVEMTGRESLFTANAQAFSGRVLVRLGRMDDAESRLLSASKSVEKPGAKVRFVQAVHEGLRDLYLARHQAEPDGGFDRKAAEWAARLNAIEAAERNP